MLEKHRRNRFILLVMLLIAVASMTVGFAAFSKELTINASAIVKPDASSFRVVFSSNGSSLATDDVKGVSEGGAMAGTASIDNNGEIPTISNLTATFTNPGQAVSYTFYSYNSGAYTAYLTGIKFNLSNGSTGKVCTAIDKASTTDSLLSAACNDISVKVEVGENSEFNGETKTISGHSLAKSGFEQVKVTILYDNNGNISDGDFVVQFPDVSLIYSSADNVTTS